MQKKWYDRFMNLLFLAPVLLIAFIPLFTDFYDTGRWILLCIATGVVLVGEIIRIIKTKKFIVPSLYTTAYIGLSVAAIASTLIVSTNKIEALTNPLGPITFLCLLFIVWLASGEGKKVAIQIQWALTVTIAVLGLIIIYQQFSITALLFPQATYLASNLWNPTGTPTSAILLFLIGIPIAISVVRDAFKKQQDRNSAIGIISILLMAVGCGITIWRYAPSLASTYLPLGTGWTVLLETYKHGLAAFFGVGAENFLSAYTLGKPAVINTTPLWNTVFLTNSSFFLHLATVYGVFGIGAYVWWVISMIKIMPTSWDLRVAWGIAIVGTLLLPPSLPFFMAITVLTACLQKESTTWKLTTLGSVVTIVILTILIAVSSIFLYRFIMGEYWFNQSLQAAQTEKNGTKAYNTAIYAIKSNPLMSRYHMSFSQINLMLANALIANTKASQVTPDIALTPDDQQLISTLVTQAIKEGKNGAALAPINVYAWTNLAGIYQNLVGSATDAQTWTVAVYQKAITLDPTNPVLRLDLGAMYVSTKEYDNAIQQFVASTALKPDYINGYYNLANAWKLKGNNAQALSALTQLQTLLSKDSNEYQTVTAEMQELQAK